MPEKAGGETEMIVVLKNGAEKAKVDELKADLKKRGLDIHESKGRDVTILGLVGDTSRIVPEEFWQTRLSKACSA